MQPHSVSKARGAADTPLSREGCRGDRPPTHCAGRHAPGLSATPTRFQGSFLGTGCRTCWHPHVKLKQHPHHLPACLSHIQPGEPAVAPAQDLGRVPPRGPGCLHEPLAQPHPGRGSLRPLLGSAGQPCTGGHPGGSLLLPLPLCPGGNKERKAAEKGILLAANGSFTSQDHGHPGPDKPLCSWAAAPPWSPALARSAPKLSLGTVWGG